MGWETDHVIEQVDVTNSRIRANSAAGTAEQKSFGISDRSDSCGVCDIEERCTLVEMTAPTEEKCPTA